MMKFSGESRIKRYSFVICIFLLGMILPDAVSGENNARVRKRIRNVDVAGEMQVEVVDFLKDGKSETRYKLKLGYTKDDLIGKSALEFMHPDDIKTVIKNRNKGLETGKAKGSLIRIKKKGGGWLWFETRSSIFSSIEGIRAIVISRDVTQQVFDQKRL